MSRFFSSHTLALQVTDTSLLLFQVVTRKGVLINIDSYNELIAFLANESTKPENLVIKNISTFSLAKCLLDNPNGLIEETVFREKLFSIPFSEAILILEELSIIVANNDYINKLGKKLSLFDKEHIGNFHQQIGDFVLKNKDINSEMWWITQKFAVNYKSTTDTAYKWVQEVFMNEFFTKVNIGGKKVLDFGSGIGYYSKFFHDLGGEVTGVDPSDQYIQIAQREFSKNTDIKFQKASFEQRSDFNIFNEKYDVIFLSDVFLYYFEPYKKMELTPSVLLEELSKILKPDGKIFILDPHGVFHLQSWFNKKNQPFMIAVEYANRKYRVTPNLEEVSFAVESAGLSISKIREVKYKGEDIDKMFYAEFPFWWFFELIKKNNECL